MKSSLRSALLGSVTTSALLAFASPAQAACVVTGQSVVCDATDTLNTTYPTSMGDDRAYLLDTTATDADATIDGAITGYGLAFGTNVGAADSMLTVVNNGGVTVDAGNTPTAGGTAALNLTIAGDTSLDYSGAGDIMNMGTAGDGLNILATGTGSVNAVVGGSVASAAGGSAIFANKTSAGAGDVNLSTTAGETVQGDVYGVVAAINNAGATGDITVDNAADVSSLTADNTIQIGVAGQTTGTGNVTVNNTGNVGSDTDSATYVAVGGSILNAASTATVTVTNGDGDVYGDVGVGASTAGDGAIVVQTGAGSVNGVTAGIGTFTSGDATTDITTGTGAVSATAGNGIDVTGGIGDVTIATGGDVSGSVSGLQVVSTGDQSISVNGVTMGDGTAGIHSDTTGDRTIDIGADGDVTGASEAILLTNTGTATITNAGIVGTDSTSLALDASAAGDVDFTNAAGGTLNGTLLFGAGNDTLTNAGTFNTQGTIDFGAGDDLFVNTGTLNFEGDTTFANLEDSSIGGTVNLNGFTATGTGDLVTTGTVNAGDGGTLVGFDTYENAGTLNLTGTLNTVASDFLNSGTVRSVNGDATITGQTAFINEGTITMVDGATNDSLTIDSDYVGGAGARLAVDASYNDADMLIVNGDISGSTAVDVNVLGTGALVSGGVQVVDGMGASTANAFTMGNVLSGSALVDYAIRQNGSDYYLTGSLNQAGFTPLRLASMVNDFWYPSADEVIANLAVPYKGGDGIGFWADGYLSREKFGDNNVGYSFGGVNYTVDQRVKLGHMGLQAGVDYGMGGTGRIGLTAGYSRHKGRDGNDIEAKGWNLGIYGAFGGVTGFHGEALAKYDRYKVDFNDGFFDPFNPKVKSFGFDGSLGYRIPMGGENASFDLAAGLSHVSSKIDDTVAYGLTYDYNRVKSTRGRASARYNFGGDLQPYVQATAYHEFANAGRVGLFDGVNTYDLENAKRGTWGRIEGGIGGSPNRFPTLAAWADFGDVKGIGARLGMRFGAEAEAAPPPPPPPPPPAEPVPPPATQTCYDGSVILATDTCPVPPPPPPPPPAPERG